MHAKEGNFFSKARHIAYVIFLTAFFVLLRASAAKAASAEVDISCENSRVSRGDEVFVLITVSSSEAIGGFEGYFTYDSSVLKYITGGSVMSGNDDEFLLSDKGRDDGAKTVKYAVKFIARHKGSATISLKRPYEVYGYEDSAGMSVSYNSLNIVVDGRKKSGRAEADAPAASKKPAPSKDPDASLEPADSDAPAVSLEPAYPVDGTRSCKIKALEVSGVELKPAFSPEIYKYSADVATDASKFDIACKAEDDGAAVKIKGNGNLTEGKNIIKIIVSNKAANGGDLKSTYRLAINIKRTYSAETLDDNIKVSLRKGKTVLGVDGDYVVAEPDADVAVPDGFAATEMKMGGHLITVYASEDDSRHRFFLIYCGRKNEKPGFYLYDKKDASLLPYEKVQSWYRGSRGGAVVADDKGEGGVERLNYIIAIMFIICLLLIIVIISLYMHFKGMDGDELAQVLKSDVSADVSPTRDEKQIFDEYGSSFEKENLVGEDLYAKEEDGVGKKDGDDWRSRHAWQGRAFDDKF